MSCKICKVDGVRGTIWHLWWCPLHWLPKRPIELTDSWARQQFNHRQEQLRCRR